MITLFDAERCPFCARVRIVLAEKGIPYEPVAIDLSNRPAWLYDKNPTGRVPVLEEDTFVLPESAVIMEYLEERYPEPPLLPADPAARALERWRVFRFDEELGDDYYAFRRGEENALLERLRAFEPPPYGFAAIAYLPWIIRTRDSLGLELPRRLADWLSELSERRAVREELDIVAALPRSTPRAPTGG
jgi:glutathione S-transferase